MPKQPRTIEPIKATFDQVVNTLAKTPVPPVKPKKTKPKK